MSKLTQRICLMTLVTLVLIVGLFLPCQQALVFYKENTDDIVAYLPIQTGNTFQLIWKHSIHLTDVVEKYKIQNNQMIQQYEIIYEEFGIGMPSNAMEGEEFVSEDGKYHIKGLDNNFPVIKLRNGKTVSENRIVWGTDDQHVVPFNHYFAPGAWFTLKVDRITVWDCLKGVRIVE